MNTYIEVMVEAGKRLGLVADVIDDGWTIRFIDKSGEEYDVIWFDVGLNSSLSRKKVSDKSMCYSLLSEAGLSAVPHWFLMPPGNTKYSVGGIFKEIYALFEASESGLVLKPNEGGAGKDVTLVKSLNDLDIASLDLFRSGSAIAVSPYYHYDVEYRVVVLDGEVQMAFGKRKMDGDFKHNLSSGSVVEQVPYFIEDELFDLAVRAADALGSRFCTVDIIDHDRDGLMIMEINNTVTLKRVADFGDVWKEMSINSYHAALSKVIETRKVMNELFEKNEALKNKEHENFAN